MVHKVGGGTLGFAPSPIKQRERAMGRKLTFRKKKNLFSGKKGQGPSDKIPLPGPKKINSTTQVLPEERGSSRWGPLMDAPRTPGECIVIIRLLRNGQSSPSYWVGRRKGPNNLLDRRCVKEPPPRSREGGEHH